MIRIAKCNAPFVSYQPAGLEFTPNGNAYRKKRQNKAFKYLQRGKALTEKHNPRVEYREIVFCPDRFARDLLAKHSTIFGDARFDGMFILMGAKDFAEVAKVATPDFGFNFSAKAAVGRLYMDRNGACGCITRYEVIGLPVVVSPRVSGILVLEKDDFMGL